MQMLHWFTDLATIAPRGHMAQLCADKAETTSIALFLWGGD
jgi:hypothetical protein